MGLDMYLSARRYVSKNGWDNGVKAVNPEFDAIAATAPDGLMKYGEFYGITVTYPIAYWRKANAIHGWFVSNCGNNQDTCQEMYVSLEDLRNLHAVCVQVAANPERANKLLPPTTGFFFGTQEVDEWYLNDLHRTIAILDHVIDMKQRVPDEFAFEVFYQASW